MYVPKEAGDISPHSVHADKSSYDPPQRIELRPPSTPDDDTYVMEHHSTRHSIQPADHPDDDGSNPNMVVPNSKDTDIDINPPATRSCRNTISKTEVGNINRKAEAFNHGPNTHGHRKTIAVSTSYERPRTRRKHVSENAATIRPSKKSHPHKIIILQHFLLPTSYATQI